MIPARRVAAGAVALLLVAGCSETAPEPDPVGPTQETLPVPRTVPGTVPGDHGPPSADHPGIAPPRHPAPRCAHQDILRDRAEATVQIRRRGALVAESGGEDRHAAES